MPDDIAISVRGLGKKYTIGGPQERFLTFRDVIVNSVKAPFRRLTQKGTDQSTNEFWALKDVSFDVHKGEIVGIIGKNGAGKSTLLKILSRITTPTEGEVDIYGRVGSLLEVGTGFHPELTGRENIFLSGSILGMKRSEIEARFDEIVKFSEIEKFIDTPVKRYSSGMYVRLAFSVAAHLEPEILIVDEVLAVGDASFQKKCLGKMGDVAKEGRTVLFVSHNMAAIQNLCNRAILLKNGSIKMDGIVKDTISIYLNASSDKNYLNEGEFLLSDRINDYNNNIPIIQKILFIDDFYNLRSSFQMGEPMTIAIEVLGLSKIKSAEIGVSFKNTYDEWVTSAATWMKKTNVAPKNRENREWFLLKIPKVQLTPGKWNLYASVSIHGAGGIYLDKIETGVWFTVDGADIYNSGHLISSHFGFFYLDFDWEIVHEMNKLLRHK